jgi:hypothetical protein
MGYGTAVTLVVPLLTIAAPSARGEPPSKCWFAGEPMITAAQVARVEALSLEINSLADHADCRPLRERLRQLLAEPCFRKLEIIAPLVECGSGFALRDWWEHGGASWIRSAIGGEYRSKRGVELPPGIRATLSLDANPGHPLAPLLCRVGDASCGRETAGWLKRANDAEVSDHLSARRHPSAPNPGQPCLKVQGKSAVDRHATWRDCIERQRHRQYMRTHLPAGAFRAPTVGWLVVRGRRGHYTFSDELAAYDLATGAAYRARQAGDLGILPADDVAAAERRKTGRRPVTAARGRVPIDNLREAALILFLWPEARPQLDALSVSLPAGVELLPLPAGFKFTELPKVIISSSGDTALSWEWIQNGRLVLAGDVVYTGSGHGRGYPTWLLELAEAGLAPGCTPAPLPPRIVGLGRPIAGVELIDAKPEELDASEVALARALGEPDPACAKPAGKPK